MLSTNRGMRPKDKGISWRLGNDMKEGENTVRVELEEPIFLLLVRGDVADWSAFIEKEYEVVLFYTSP